ncbi:uncharacterized protein BO96DRAFT_475573 [Aspergillus niger CBS 101883]|uniref:Uncharacterized protein n=3 Tax=Aspergillus niger TaxID=5061 RepID=A2QZH9_ASPNC|nr:uncharacterized protein BO96DRAFT_475573 [Aspergillus niger CBS 101883]XP_059604448.1 hypothetical protein An12g04975 [Aspergillus niger]PYH56006.1 hypothetical protein BO96DRAFT_475573 [Aspergillus niger CBS 101883]RDH17092.1 hypothetical protein M747DRAFT_243534 [Aspergillus niger ATCC 13496]CAK46211.1 hypothetical protein An12g04975 [Aspergillus niger]
MRSFPHVRSPWRIRHNGHAVEPRVQLQPYIRWTRDNRQGGQGHEDTGTDQLSITSFPEGYIRGGSVATCWFELEQSFRPDPSKEDDHTVCLSGDGRYQSAIRARSFLNVRLGKTWALTALDSNPCPRLYDHFRVSHGMAGWLDGCWWWWTDATPLLPQVRQLPGVLFNYCYYYYRTFGTELKWSSNPNRRTANSGRNVRAIVVFGRSGHSSAGHGSCLIRESSSSSTKPKTQQPIFIHRYPRLPRRGGGGRFSRPVRPSSPLQIPARCLAWPRLALNPSVASPHHPGGWMNNSPLAPRTSFLLGLKNRCILPESSTSSHR